MKRTALLATLFSLSLSVASIARADEITAVSGLVCQPRDSAHASRAYYQELGAGNGSSTASLDLLCPAPANMTIQAAITSLAIFYYDATANGSVSCTAFSKNLNMGTTWMATQTSSVGDIGQHVFTWTGNFTSAHTVYGFSCNLPPTGAGGVSTITGMELVQPIN